TKSVTARAGTTRGSSSARRGRYRPGRGRRGPALNHLMTASLGKKGLPDGSCTGDGSVHYQRNDKAGGGEGWEGKIMKKRSGCPVPAAQERGGEGWQRPRDYPLTPGALPPAARGAEGHRSPGRLGAAFRPSPIENGKTRRRERGG